MSCILAWSAELTQKSTDAGLPAAAAGLVALSQGEPRVVDPPPTGGTTTWQQRTQGHRYICTTATISEVIDICKSSSSLTYNSYRITICCIACTDENIRQTTAYITYFM